MSKTYPKGIEPLEAIRMAQILVLFFEKNILLFSIALQLP